METQRINDLLHRYLHKTATPAEREELFLLVQSLKNDAPLEEVLSGIDVSLLPPVSLPEEAGREMLEAILRVEPVAPVAMAPVHRVHFLRKWRWAVAVVLVLGVALAFWMNRKDGTTPDMVKMDVRDVVPGKEGAVLTLADGSQVVLDSMGNGLVATQHGAQAVIRNGQLVYEPTQQTSGEVLYNTMTTPRGRQFQVMLPDGSKAWLNCASSIRFPTVFSGQQRVVEVTGEVYLEVAKNAARPFIVQLPNQSSIEVLGTSFNINAYEDEPTVKTTLLEGAIQYKRGTEVQKLVPGDQVQDDAQARNGLRKKQVEDIEEIVAWKNGYFSFSGTNFSTIMRQLARWYNVEVVVSGALPARSFSASVSRNISLENLLKAMEVYGIRSSYENGRVVITP